jgi:hypothetical protein
MRRSFLVTGLVLVAALAWAARLAVGDGPWPTDAAVLLGADLVLLATVSVVGILVAASRWAARLALGVAAAGLPVALALPFDGLWWIALITSAVAVGGIAGGGLKGYVRERPNASGPPTEAVLLSLGLLALPGVVGAAGVDGIGAGGWLVTVGSLAVAGWYVKAAPGATTVVRVATPLLAAGAALALGWPGGIVPVAFALALTWVAWTPAARLAVKPLLESGSRIAIPPELAPREILDAAGLDERGRRRQEER